MLRRLSYSVVVDIPLIDAYELNQTIVDAIVDITGSPEVQIDEEFLYE